MKTDQTTEPNKTVFLQTIAVAVAQLKQQLQRDYERTYPDLREIIQLILDKEVSCAWDLTSFPHLLLPDLVEAHVAKLNLRPATTKHENVFAPHRDREVDLYEPALALAG